MQARATNVLTLLVRHGTGRYESAHELLLHMMRAMVPGTPQRIVVVDNSLSAGVREVDSGGIELIDGSNSDWEFSAWDSGIEYVRPMLKSVDLVLLATSAFNQYDPRHLGLIDDAMLRWQVGKPVAVGHIDFFDEPVEYSGKTLQAWLRSSFVLVPPEVLMRLGSLVSVDSSVSLFSGHPSAPFREEAPISENYKRYLLGWLTESGTGQGIQWHSRFDLNSETLPFFEKKARAILNEQMMTQRLMACGCKIADVSWLARRLDRHGGPSIDDVPAWRVQVYER